ncbi:MAG: hypothetical protein Kilf2KO_22450 [Rhodospirillales bacterium]
MQVGFASLWQLGVAPVIRSLLVLLTLVLLAPSVSADEGKAADKAYQACLDRADTTTAQLGCIDRAYKAWDKILNANYKAAMASLDHDNKKLLRQAQRDWLAYRDADRAFRGGSWSQGQGTIMTVILSGVDVEIVKARAQVLDSYGPLGE